MQEGREQRVARADRIDDLHVGVGRYGGKSVGTRVEQQRALRPHADDDDTVAVAFIQSLDEFLRRTGQRLVAEEENVGVLHEIAVVVVFNFTSHMHVGSRQSALGMCLFDQPAVEIDIAKYGGVRFPQRLCHALRVVHFVLNILQIAVHLTPPLVIKEDHRGGGIF